MGIKVSRVENSTETSRHQLDVELVRSYTSQLDELPNSGNEAAAEESLSAAAENPQKISTSLGTSEENKESASLSSKQENSSQNIPKVQVGIAKFESDLILIIKRYLVLNDRYKDALTEGGDARKTFWDTMTAKKNVDQEVVVQKMNKVIEKFKEIHTDLMELKTALNTVMSYRFWISNIDVKRYHSYPKYHTLLRLGSYGVELKRFIITFLRSVVSKEVEFKMLKKALILTEKIRDDHNLSTGSPS